MNHETPLERLYHGTATADLPALAETLLSPDVAWHVAHPVNTLRGSENVVGQWLLPLREALPDIERRPTICLSDGGEWIAGTGFFVGTFAQALFGIPATGRTLYLRYTELVRSADGRIVESYLIPDFLDAMWQAGCYPLRPGLGHPGIVPGPATQDGLWPVATSEARSASSERLVMDMLDCLRKYDGVRLDSMDLENFWHPDFMWYGPGGIGTTRGIAGFRAHHQGPFLAAFPDRDVDHHACTVACGDYVATGG